MFVIIDIYGVRRFGSLGNMLDLRMLFKPKYNMTTLSKPTPHPPCGNAPYLNDRM